MKQHFIGFALLSFLAIACQPEAETPPGTEPYNLVAPELFPKQVVPANNPTTVQGVELGRFLFYEKKLSGNNTMSCGSCHQQKFAFTDGGKAVSLGIDKIAGTRNTMSLANIGWEKDLNWDGKAKTLEEQARIPIESTVEMHQNLKVAVNRLQNTSLYPPLFMKAFGSSVVTEERILKALAQFQRTLVSANSRYDQYERGEANMTTDEKAGKKLFAHPENGVTGIMIRGGNCGDCHDTRGLFTRQLIVNNGLDEQFSDTGLGGVTGKATDNGKFKIPTLRNIDITGPYMHDGRFKTLEEVLDHYNDHVKFKSPNIAPDMFITNNVPTPGDPNPPRLGLTATEKRQIIAFLKTLTDTTFINDKRFSDPFQK